MVSLLVFVDRLSNPKTLQFRKRGNAAVFISQELLRFSAICSTIFWRWFFAISKCSDVYAAAIFWDAKLIGLEILASKSSDAYLEHPEKPLENRFQSCHGFGDWMAWIWRDFGTGKEGLKKSARNPHQFPEQDQRRPKGTWNDNSHETTLNLMLLRQRLLSSWLAISRLLARNCCSLAAVVSAKPLPLNDGRVEKSSFHGCYLLGSRGGRIGTFQSRSFVAVVDSCAV